jgi:IS1 family transposase
VSVELLIHVIACLAAGLGMRGTARGFAVEPHTVLQWLVEAAAPLQAFTASCLREVQIPQVQLDELYAVLSAVRDGNMGEAEAIERLSRSPHWVWTAIDPASKRLLHVQSGERTRAMAHVVLQQLAPLWAPGCVPLFLSDGSPNYLTAIVTPGGPWMPPPRRQAPGPGPKPRWRPLPGLLSAPVVNSSRCRRLVEVNHRVVCGTTGAVDQLVAACGWHINTSFVERLHLRLRQRVAARGRRSAMPCQSDDGLGQQRALCQVYHNFGWPHASVRQALAAPISTYGTGAAKVGRPCTPAMAAGLTDHVWSLREVLLFRVPPWPPPQTL